MNSFANAPRKDKEKSSRNQIVTELSEAISVTEEVAETTSLISATINEPCGRRELQKINRQTCATKKHKTNPITTGRSEDTAVHWS